MDPVVTQVHSKEKRWRDEFSALRGLCLASGLTESLKWGQACYHWNGANIVLIHGFKDYCALLFMKGVLLTDTAGILVQQTPNVQAQRQIRFVSAGQIAAQSELIGEYISAAISIEKAGLKVPMKTLEQFDMPLEFSVHLARDPELAAAFYALTAGRQKAYLLHFAGAKQSATRAARVEKNIPKIRKGLGLDFVAPGPQDGA